MAVSIISDMDRYFRLIADTINDNGLIVDPKQFTGLIKLSQCKGRIIGWEIDGTEIRFVTDDILDVMKDLLFMAIGLLSSLSHTILILVPMTHFIRIE